MTTAAARRALGVYGEEVAARALTEAGMVVLDRNWRARQGGELDLVLRDGEVLVACEVKTRRGLSCGHPLEAVTPAKAQRMVRLIDQWALEHGVRAAEIRIDVVSVLRPLQGPADVEHVRGWL
jgi:putative endonuclease